MSYTFQKHDLVYSACFPVHCCGTVSCVSGCCCAFSDPSSSCHPTQGSGFVLSDASAPEKHNKNKLENLTQLQEIHRENWLPHIITKRILCLLRSFISVVIYTVREWSQKCCFWRARLQQQQQKKLMSNSGCSSPCAALRSSLRKRFQQ